jgi:hypothetical protein
MTDSGAPTRRRAPELLVRRALNRALLERQLLLRRHALGPLEAIDHLVGVQAQAPLAPYVALWSRLEGFSVEDLARPMQERRAVRTHVMRATIHLVSAGDCPPLRALMQSVLVRRFGSTPFARNLAGVDLAPLLDAGRAMLDERPHSRAELGRRLAERWPGWDAESLSAAICYLVPAVQVTPRGVWGASGAIAWTTIESWLGQQLPPAPPADEAVLRYLGAFGPATVADVRAWSGLAELAAVTDRLRPRLRSFRDEAGRELFDLPDAPRPDPETPAPPRFLPEYDNVLLSHHDRSRINDGAHAIPLYPGNGGVAGHLLVDGFYRGLWRIVRQDARACLRITWFDAAPDELGDVVSEGRRLLAFAAADAAEHEVDAAAG